MSLLGSSHVKNAKIPYAATASGPGWLAFAVIPFLFPRFILLECFSLKPVLLWHHGDRANWYIHYYSYSLLLQILNMDLKTGKYSLKKYRMNKLFASRQNKVLAARRKASSCVLSAAFSWLNCSIFFYFTDNEFEQFHHLTVTPPHNYT